jgi:hypothetical protein
MNLERTLLLTPLLLLGAALPAQSQYVRERVAMIGQPTPKPGLSSGTLGYQALEDFFVTPGDDPTNLYATGSGQLVQGGPFVMKAFRYNAVTDVATPVDDYDAIRQNGDRNPSVSRDLRTSAFWRGEIMVSRRNGPDDPWGTPVPISGLPQFPYSPYLTQIENGARQADLGLVVCVPLPTPNIQLFRLDPALAVATHVATFFFTMQRLPDYWEFAAPIEDPVTGLLVGMMLCYRQGFPNNGSVLHHLAGLNGKSPVLDVYGATGNVFTGGSMMWGGSFLAVSRGGGPGAPSWVNNAVQIDTVFATDAEVDQNGGWLDLRVYSPAGIGLSALAVGFGSMASTPIPNVIGNFALQAPFVFLPLVPTPGNGVATWSLMTGPLTPADLVVQAVWAHFAIYLGGSAALTITT